MNRFRVSEIAASKSSSGLPLANFLDGRIALTEILKRIPPRPIRTSLCLGFLLVAYVSYQAGRAVQPTSEEPRITTSISHQANRPNLSQEAGASTPGPDDRGKTKAPTNDSKAHVKALTDACSDSAREGVDLTDIVSSFLDFAMSEVRETHPARPVESLQAVQSTSTSFITGACRRRYRGPSGGGGGSKRAAASHGCFPMAHRTSRSERENVRPVPSSDVYQDSTGDAERQIDSVAAGDKIRILRRTRTFSPTIRSASTKRSSPSRPYDRYGHFWRFESSIAHSGFEP